MTTSKSKVGEKELKMRNNIQIEISQALARGYTYEQNSTKVLDADLISAMTKEVYQVIFPCQNKEKWNGVCKCGHKHDRHGKSFSINFSAGLCKDCKCKNFIHDFI